MYHLSRILPNKPIFCFSPLPFFFSLSLSHERKFVRRTKGSRGSRQKEIRVRPVAKLQCGHPMGLFAVPQAPLSLAVYCRISLSCGVLGRGSRHNRLPLRATTGKRIRRSTIVLGGVRRRDETKINERERERAKKIEDLDDGNQEEKEEQKEEKKEEEEQDAKAGPRASFNSLIRRRRRGARDNRAFSPRYFPDFCAVLPPSLLPFELSLLAKRIPECVYELPSSERDLSRVKTLPFPPPPFAACWCCRGNLVIALARVPPTAS